MTIASPLSIRHATPDDTTTVCALLASQLAEHDIHLPPERLQDAVRGMITHCERGCILLASLAGTPIGVACLVWLWTLEHGGPSAWLDELYIVPAARERGHGQTLLHAAIAQARAAGALALDLEVDASHARATSLYLREGFQPHRRSRFVLPLSP